MSDIVPLQQEHLPQVARLFSSIFLKASSPPPQLERYLSSLFLDGPDHTPELCSRVYINDHAQVSGFIGVFALDMHLGERPLKAAAVGSLMVENPASDPLAGARLIKTALSGPQDLTFSETANPLSQRMFAKAGARVVESSSLEWIKMLRPLGMAAALGAVKAGFLRTLVPLFRFPDTLLMKLTGALTSTAVPHRLFQDRSVDEEELIRVILLMGSDVTLGPRWTPELLRHRLFHAREKSFRGPMQCHVIYGPKDMPVGWYVCHVRSHDLCWILDMQAKVGHEETVLDHLLATQAAQGCVAVKGRTQPRMLSVLMLKNPLFLHRCSTVFHTQDADIIAAVERGDAALTGLCAEGWVRLIGDDLAG